MTNRDASSVILKELHTLRASPTGPYLPTPNQAGKLWLGVGDSFWTPTVMRNNIP